MPLCINCKQKINGLNRIFKENQVLDVCPRCGYQNAVIMRIAAKEELKKYADAWDTIKNALVTLAPAVAVTGAWELLTAYETFKKVMENMLAAQQPKSWNPFFANKKSYPVRNRTFSLIDGWKDRISQADLVAYDEGDYKRIIQVCAANVLMNGEQKSPSDWAKYGWGMSQMGKGPGVILLKAILFNLLPSTDWVEFNSTSPELIAQAVKKAYLERDPFGPVTPHEGDLEPYFVTDFNQLMEFVKQVTPIVVEYSMKSKDDTMLKGLSQLVNSMREFRRQIHNTTNFFVSDYDRMEEEHDYKKKPQFAQESVMGN